MGGQQTMTIGIGRRVIIFLTRLVTWFNKNQRVSIRAEPVKVNLGSGLAVAKGWVNIDGSLNALLSTWPSLFLRKLYRFSDAHQWYSQEEYIKILKENVFVQHRLDYGVPFKTESIDYLYSSHMLEHLFPEDATALVTDMYRALKTGGRLRLAVPDLEHAIGLYQTGQKEAALRYFFIPSRSELFDQHHYMYDFELLKRLLESAGFREIERCSFQVGKVPDIQHLDNRPEETLFVEAGK